MTLTANEASRPVLALVGRPNVGKSALFNRLAGRRVAIVHEESGVTRDRLTCPAAWNGRRYELIDTGGVDRVRGEGGGQAIAAGVRRQVDLAIEEAAVILLVTDLTDGLLPVDREVADLLHRSGKPVFVAANKADHEGMDAQAADFETLGFPVFPVSALHRRGIEALMDAAAPALPPPVAEEDGKPLRLTVAGRPNAGKSSFINRLLSGDRLIVSELPGTTRDSIEVPLAVGSGAAARRYVLVDTAGMRKAGKAREAVEKFSLIRAAESIRGADLVLLVLDAAEGPKTQDMKIARMTEEMGRGLVLLVNKWDLAQGKGITQRAYGKALREALPFLGHVPVVYTSALSGFNIRSVLQVVDEVAGHWRAEIGTGILNRVLRAAAERSPPPAVSGKRLKIYYATQVGKAPPVLRLFVNDPGRLTATYKTYLGSSLRKAFGLIGTPLVLQFRGKPRNPS